MSVARATWPTWMGPSIRSRAASSMPERRSSSDTRGAATSAAPRIGTHVSPPPSRTAGGAFSARRNHSEHFTGLKASAACFGGAQRVDGAFSRLLSADDGRGRKHARRNRRDRYAQGRSVADGNAVAGGHDRRGSDRRPGDLRSDRFTDEGQSVAQHATFSDRRWHRVDTAGDAAQPVARSHARIDERRATTSLGPGQSAACAARNGESGMRRPSTGLRFRPPPSSASRSCETAPPHSTARTQSPASSTSS